MLPQAFLDKMETLLGEDFEAFLTGYEKEEFHGLRFNPLKENPDFQNRLIDSWNLRPVPWCGKGYYYDQASRPGKNALHEAGVYYIQEPSAMAPGHYLDAQPGDYVLDLCSAPGGKATQIAGALDGQGLLIANEIVPSRAKILSENIERMGVTNAIVTNEDPDTLADHFPEYFDRIMVDAPCSGEGMFRKNTDAQEEWSPDNVEICWKRQSDILNAAAQMLTPGGRMVYSTCTFSPEENEGSIQRFLDSHPDFHLLAADKVSGMGDGHPEWAYYGCDNDDLEGLSALTGTIRLWPHLIDGEGHFTAIMERDGQPIPKADRLTPKKLEKGLKEKSLTEFLDFSKGSLNLELSGTYLKFGDQLYLGPDLMPSLKGLKVLRPGLHLGTVLKGRFEPSHALALALKPHQVRNTVDLTSTVNNSLMPEENQDAIDFPAEKFIAGESFSCDANKGWNLITLYSYPLGWGKYSNGTMKNHYPKGLRKQV